MTAKLIMAVKAADLKPGDIIYRPRGVRQHVASVAIVGRGDAELVRCVIDKTPEFFNKGAELVVERPWPEGVE